MWACLVLLQAECWLSALENTMRCTVQKEIQEAVAAYEDKPREQWLFDYPAQVWGFIIMLKLYEMC